MLVSKDFVFEQIALDMYVMSKSRKGRMTDTVYSKFEIEMLFKNFEIK